MPNRTKKETKAIRRKAIKIQNKLYPRKVSMAEAMVMAQREE